MCSNVDEGISRAGNSHCTKNRTDCVLSVLGLGLSLALACYWLGQQITQRANCVKMGKDKGIKEKVDGCLAGVREQPKPGGLAGSVLLMGWWVCVLPSWGLVSVSVRSMTAHIAHTGHEQSTGHEYGDDVVWHGGAGHA